MPPIDTDAHGNIETNREQFIVQNVEESRKTGDSWTLGDEWLAERVSSRSGMPGGIPSASTGPALTARKPRAASEAIIAVFLRKYPFLQVWVSRSIEHMPGRLSPLPELAREMVSPSALLYT